MSAERVQRGTNDPQLSEKYYVETSRVLDLHRLVDNLGYGARTKYERDDSNGFLYLLEDSRVETDRFEPGFDLSLEERHRRIDDTIRRYRSSGDDQYLGVIRRQLPARVRRLTISVLRYTTGEGQVLSRTRHQLSWTPNSNLAIGRKIVTTSFGDKAPSMISVRNFGDTPIADIGSDSNLPFLIPEDMGGDTFDELEQQVYSLAARVRHVA